MMRFYSTLLIAALHLFWISPSEAKDIALLFALDCEQDGHFGAPLHNESRVLSRFGWEVHIYCGAVPSNFTHVDPQMCPFTTIEGNLTRKELFCALSEMKLKEGDNLFVTINTHGLRAIDRT